MNKNTNETITEVRKVLKLIIISLCIEAKNPKEINELKEKINNNKIIKKKYLE